ncbi:MAG: ATP-binding cassette domain-containing protein [Candidatus Bathyarchaeota archaeon]|nr:ATP-binding cassette domain-containing protein [Candidatus Bathyarchaeum tardum]WGM90474.1 MAG: ATP-binding cassette domain-containing protein [Candidatus Bathyarchaeum tardum]
MRHGREYFRINKFARRYDRESGKFTFNIGYETKTDITDRTVEVAEAFGMGISEFQEHVLYDNVELKIGPKDIVYLTGDSGSGKSVLLKAIVGDLKADEATRLNEVEVDPDKPLIDTVGDTVEEGLKLLSKVGLNDAFLFVRRYSQLSDGQKYRYRLAKLIESGAQWWIMDEFCATLDRETAKIVAYNVQKLARQLGKAVVAATTHTDLFEDLAPSVHIHKRFGSEVTVNYYPNKTRPQCSLLEEMTVEEGSYEDWKQVSGFHYRSHRVAFIQKIFVLKRGDCVCGAVVYVCPMSAAPCRSRILKLETMKDLNEKLTRIARVVIHPKYRTIGASVNLLRESLPLCGKPNVEMIAVMARYNPFAEHAGMVRVCNSKPDKTILEAISKLEKLGLTSYLLSVPEYNKQKLKGNVTSVKEILEKFSYPYNRRIAGAHGNFTKGDYFKWLQNTEESELARALTRLAQLNQSKVYLFWKRQ